jgi:hypothetical protein
MPVAPMPDHGRTDRPEWRRLWVQYKPVTTPLRACGLPCDVETSGGQTVIYVDLPDGSHLVISDKHELPDQFTHVKGWQVTWQHPDNPTVYAEVYDSTEDGDQETHGAAVEPMLSAVLGWITGRFHFPELVHLLTRFADANSACECGMPHPVTNEQRRALMVGIENMRAAGTFEWAVLHLIQLTGDCPAVPKSTDPEAFTIHTASFPAAAYSSTGLHAGPYDTSNEAAKEYGWYTHGLARDGWQILHHQGGTERLMSVWRHRQNLHVVWVQRMVAEPGPGR